MAHPLDNPIWESLNTSLARFAQSSGTAKRFLPEVSMLGGFQKPSQEGFDSLTALVNAGDSIGVLFTQPTTPPAGWTSERETPLLQMIHSGGAFAGPAINFSELDQADIPNMMDLTTLTKPGPFAVRTRELGDYIGVRENGKLIAMAGERFRVPGFTEISAVCTHPDYLGRGHARALMAVLANRIRARNEVPFLHVRPDNTRAAEFYERLGFTTRILLQYALLRREVKTSR